MKSPFTSIELFRREFNNGLHRLAEEGGIGTFILACANATCDENLLNDIRPLLEKQYRDLYENCRSAFLRGRGVDVVDEDLLVFLKLHTMGFDEIRMGELRQEAIWKIQFNHLRSFRPKRITQFVHTGTMYEPFSEDAFNFNKSFMAAECFWQGELSARQVDLFYNKYPFADLHGLLVLDRLAMRPQLLDYDNHQYIFDLCHTLESGFKGVGFGYNSYGAYASVNHLHFQMFVDAAGLPVTNSCWLHNGGNKEYPASCRVFYDASSSWVFIQKLQAAAQPYNALYVPGKMYVYPRKTQGTVKVPVWSSGFTWYELSGGVVAFNRDDYKNIRESEIVNHLRAIRVEG
jgi:hypothetical protein